MCGGKYQQLLKCAKQKNNPLVKADTAKTSYVSLAREKGPRTKNLIRVKQFLHGKKTLYSAF